jgi:hypothetical protein
MKNLFIYLLFVVGILISCEKEDNKETQESNDIILLNDKIVVDEELNISYQVPLNWNEMPASLSEKYVARLSGNSENEFILYTPKSFFFEKATSALLRVGKISLKEKKNSLILTPQKYVEMFMKYNSTLKINFKNITLKGNEIIELSIEKGNLISYKIIFNNWEKDILQFDFSIAKENITKIKPAIDASVKSIKLL